MSENDYSASGEGIEICEVQGKRNEQQDTIFVAKLGSKRAIRSPSKFLSKAIKKIVERHQNCPAGSTICSAIINPAGEEYLQEGKFLPKVTLANLGDSRAAMIFRFRNGENIRHVSLILTEDHSLDVERVRKQVEDNGGEIVTNSSGSLRVVNNESCPSLNMGAALGNCNLKSNQAGISPLMNKPDLFTYDVNTMVNHFMSPNEVVEAADLILACDGLYDLLLPAAEKFQVATLAADYQAKITGETLTFHEVVVGDEMPHLSKLAQDFYNRGSQGSFAAELVDTALKFNSSDNISVARIKLMEIKNDLIATVCDGHVVGTQGTMSDGKSVSASAAAELYIAAKAVAIVGLQEQIPQEMFHQVLETKIRALQKGRSEDLQMLEPTVETDFLVEEVAANFIQTPDLSSVPDLTTPSPKTSPLKNKSPVKLKNNISKISSPSLT